MGSEPDIEDAPGAIELPAVQGRVAFEHVSFGYDDDRLILKDVSFTAEPGQTIALVGPTGAGKTTIVNLLSRFYDPTEGRVTIDGYDIRDVTVKSLRAQVMAMMQESFVFSGNIMDNIRYGRPDATDEECIAAARSVMPISLLNACLTDIIPALRSRERAFRRGNASCFPLPA